MQNQSSFLAGRVRRGGLAGGFGLVRLGWSGWSGLVCWGRVGRVGSELAGLGWSGWVGSVGWLVGSVGWGRCWVSAGRVARVGSG